MARRLVVHAMNHRSRLCPRRGVALIELLVAFPMMALLSTVTVVVLLATLRLARQDDGNTGALRELHAASGALRSELQRLRPDELLAWRDTLLELETMVGLGIVCAADGVGGSATVIAPDPSDLPAAQRNPAAAVWHEPPQAGDLLTFWSAPLTDASPANAGPAEIPLPFNARLQSLASGSTCGMSPLPGAVRTVRLEYLPVLNRPAIPLIGAPVRVTRRIRYSLYRATDGLWYLGRRAFGPAGWDIVQPVAGPLSAPLDGGMRVTVTDWQGQALAAPSDLTVAANVVAVAADGASARSPATVQITLRAPRRVATTSPVAAATDSVQLSIAFRSRPAVALR